MIEGVIFDFDNTIFDYDLCNKKALERMFVEIEKKHLIPYEKVDKTFRKINIQIKTSNNSGCKFHKYVYIQQLCESLKIPLIHVQEYLDIYNQIFKKHFQLNEGIIPLFEFLKSKKIKIGVCSNNVFYQQYQKCMESKILQYIDILQTSDLFGEEKPNPNIYSHILEKMELPNEKIIWVGDSLEHDVYPCLEKNILAFHYCPIKSKNNNSEIVDKVFCKSYEKKFYYEVPTFQSLLNFINQLFYSIDRLIFLSKHFGQSVINTQGAGGNISVKVNDECLLIKSSGSTLGNMTVSDGYCLVHTPSCIKCIEENRENDLRLTKIQGNKNPSMETFFHAFMKKYTIHIHFTLSNIFFCSNQKSHHFLEDEHFEQYKIIDYVPPGLNLCKNIMKVYSDSIPVYYLKNHGLIISTNHLGDVFKIYSNIFDFWNIKSNHIFTKEMKAMNIQKFLYLNFQKTLIIRYTQYDSKIFTPIIYCFPDLAIFISLIFNISSKNHWQSELEKKIRSNSPKMCNVLIIENEVYLVAETINQLYGLEEIISSYNTLYSLTNNYSKNLVSIEDVSYIQNMEAEKYRKKS